jgi:hypothetical protein
MAVACLDRTPELHSSAPASGLQWGMNDRIDFTGFGQARVRRPGEGLRVDICFGGKAVDGEGGLEVD